MIVYVTQDDINKGQAGCPGICPVALALRRAFKLSRFDLLSVGYTAFNVQRDPLFREAIYTLPDRVSEWIMQYDEEVSVEPFDFELPGLS